ncbi:MAG: fused MFS/spermidine synthase [Bryobacteraceae bacterium]
MLVYAVTIFLSAFLLFQIQPMIAKFILPWFGGGAAVWSAALLFFQLVLLAGYTYAHFLIKYLSPKKQFKVHLILLVLAMATLPIIPADRWKPTGGGDATFQILALLVATIGLPYMILSATSPLLQAWYVRTHEGVIPYRLFALSNFGSMLALLSYPFLVEPNIALHNQAWIWSGGFAIFGLACAFAAWKSSDPKNVAATPEAITAPVEIPAPPKMGSILYWIGLSACASALLLATTSSLTQNVAPIPMLWIAPLSIYLLSFILSFESEKIYQRWLFLPLGMVALAFYTRGMNDYENNEDVIHWLIPILCGAFFVACMICHGELAKRKPHPRYLTQYFLMISVGGAIGGLFVAFLAPRAFPDYWEMPISLAVLALLMALAVWNEENGEPRPLPIRLALLIVVGSFAIYLGRIERNISAGYDMTNRDFYGVLRVRDDPADGGLYPVRVLIHGTINHGTQLLAQDGGRIPTSYFGNTSGINRAIRAKGEKGPIRIGILGLGAGVTATLARKEDTLHYYELNPTIFDIAKTRFDFWKACPADKKIFFGDGRLTLEEMPDEQLDFLAMDAFTSDAVPMHLLTEEAFKIYARHLKPDGVIAINISNRYLDLRNVVSSSAKANGFSSIMIYDEGTSEPYYVSNTWTLFNRDKNFFSHPNFQGPETTELVPDKGFRSWTDDYSNILNILN